MNGTASKNTALSERDNKPNTYRRIVAGNAHGKAVVQSMELRNVLLGMDPP
jgi:hypothetical protein